ncbi:MAG: LCP family protein, partial [Methanobrevibacter sp.]|nr:LCP family protein [Methanobrevibacter sp.]
MDKNKSIDGLKPRQSQKKSTPKKTTSPKKVASNKKSVKKSAAINKTTQKTVKKTKDNISLTTTQLNNPDDSLTNNTPQTTNPFEDFLNPVQTFDFDEVSGNLKATAPTNQTKVKKHQPKVKKPMSKKRKIILIIILVILLLLLAAGVGFILWGNDIIAKITGGQGNVFDLVFQNDVYEPLKTDSNGRTNILAFGTSGYNMDGEEGNGVHDGAQLTDSIMVISLDQETGDIAMLSLPRDLKASPTCTATGKINEVYWCNNMDGDNESAGANALMEEVNRILGIDFQYYAHLNWGSLIQIVDALGGITVTLDEDISDYYYTGAVFEAGKEYTINGDQALGLARARHGTESGDFSRGASQQKILVGIKDKVIEKGLSITDIINLASALGDNLRT